MDPLSQGVMGAIAAQAAAAKLSAKPEKSPLAAAALIGVISGITPDLDVVIRSASDPLFSLEYHRHFTHSLLFIPLGSLLCALFIHILLGRTAWFKSRSLGFKTIYLYCFVAYATHGLLDACTTYGTQLFWPLSNARIAWNTISIIDPLFTLPLLVFVTIAAISSRRWFTYGAVTWVIIYTGFGIMQRERAINVGYKLAQTRGHEVQDLRATPSFANIIVWKIIYRYDGYFYVDAVKVGLSNHHIFQGERIKELELENDFPWLEKNSQQAKDVERFRWFSNDYLAVSLYHPNRIIDMRYSLLPNQVRGLWGIELDPNKSLEEHIDYVVDHGRRKKALKDLYEMINY